MATIDNLGTSILDQSPEDLQQRILAIRSSRRTPKKKVKQRTSPSKRAPKAPKPKDPLALIKNLPPEARKMLIESLMEEL